MVTPSEASGGFKVWPLASGGSDDDAKTEEKGEPVEAVGEVVGASASGSFRARSAGGDATLGGGNFYHSAQRRFSPEVPLPPPSEIVDEQIGVSGADAKSFRVPVTPIP